MPVLVVHLVEPTDTVRVDCPSYLRAVVELNAIERRLTAWRCPQHAVRDDDGHALVEVDLRRVTHAEVV